MAIQKIDQNELIKRVVLKMKVCREAHKLSQKDIAESLHVGLRSYQRIENGESGLDLSLLARFCDVIKVDFLDFINPYAPTPLDLEIYQQEHEINNFLEIEFVKLMNVLHWKDILMQEGILLGERKDFLSSKIPLCVWTPTKKVMNDAFLEFYKIKKTERKSNLIFFDPIHRMNFFDCLHYFRPENTKKICRKMYRKEARPVEVYSTHVYIKDEIHSFSGIKFVDHC